MSKASRVALAALLCVSAVYATIRSAAPASCGSPAAVRCACDSSEPDGRPAASAPCCCDEAHPQRGTATPARVDGAATAERPESGTVAPAPRIWSAIEALGRESTKPAHGPEPPQASPFIARRC
ncbi:MAG: hypothetical protein HYY06_13595 [Deltaproteobacteria bacterium]|nr:hypothetical protein [Deltaproteobacteria bacterium]